MHHFGNILVIQGGDFTLFESRTVIRYIAMKYEGQGTTLGSNLKERVLVKQLLEVEGHNFDPPVVTLVVEIVYALKCGVENQALIDNKEQ
eukprot:Gb_23480 [translate_table: standard]